MRDKFILQRSFFLTHKPHVVDGSTVFLTIMTLHTSYRILQLFTAFGHFVRFFGIDLALFEYMMVYATNYVIFMYACLMLFQVISASVSFYHTMDRSRPVAAVTAVVIRHRLVGIPFVLTGPYHP